MNSGMVSTRQTIRSEQLVLAIFVCAAVAAFGSAFNQPLAWIFWVPALISPFWQVGRLPPAIAKWGKYAAWPLLACTLILGLVLMAYPPLFSERLTHVLIFVCGYGLALCASAYLLG